MGGEHVLPRFLKLGITERVCGAVLCVGGGHDYLVLNPGKKGDGCGRGLASAQIGEGGGEAVGRAAVHFVEAWTRRQHRADGVVEAGKMGIFAGQVSLDGRVGCLAHPQKIGGCFGLDGREGNNLGLPLNA